MHRRVAIGLSRANTLSTRDTQKGNDRSRPPTYLRQRSDRLVNSYAASSFDTTLHLGCTENRPSVIVNCNRFDAIPRYFVRSDSRSFRSRAPLRIASRRDSSRRRFKRSIIYLITGRSLRGQRKSSLERLPSRGAYFPYQIRCYTADVSERRCIFRSPGREKIPALRLIAAHARHCKPFPSPSLSMISPTTGCHWTSQLATTGGGRVARRGGRFSRFGHALELDS